MINTDAPGIFGTRAAVLLITAGLTWTAGACPVATPEGDIDINSLTRHTFSPLASVRASDVDTTVQRARAATACEGGFAGIYPCSDIDLMSFLPLADIGGGSGNDIWG